MLTSNVMITIYKTTPPKSILALFVILSVLIPNTCPISNKLSWYLASKGFTDMLKGLQPLTNNFPVFLFYMQVPMRCRFKLLVLKPTPLFVSSTIKGIQCARPTHYTKHVNVHVWVCIHSLIYTGWCVEQYFTCTCKAFTLANTNFATNFFLMT